MKTGVVFFALIVCIFVVALVVAQPKKDDDAISTEHAEDVVITQEGLDGRADLTRDTCVASGGQWNPCGSACRENPDAICIELCVEYCECGQSTQCPLGYSCSQYVEGKGVCL